MRLTKNEIDFKLETKKFDVEKKIFQWTFQVSEIEKHSETLTSKERNWWYSTWCYSGWCFEINCTGNKLLTFNKKNFLQTIIVST